MPAMGGESDSKIVSTKCSTGVRQVCIGLAALTPLRSLIRLISFTAEPFTGFSSTGTLMVGRLTGHRCSLTEWGHEGQVSNLGRSARFVLLPHTALCLVPGILHCPSMCTHTSWLVHHIWPVCLAAVLLVAGLCHGQARQARTWQHHWYRELMVMTFSIFYHVIAARRRSVQSVATSCDSQLMRQAESQKRSLFEPIRLMSHISSFPTRVDKSSSKAEIFR